MAISTAIRNLLFIAIFAYIYNAGSVLSDEVKEQRIPSEDDPLYHCSCSTVIKSEEELQVKGCSCAGGANHPPVISFNCSVAHSHRSSVMKRASRLVREAGEKGLPSSEEQPGIDAAETARVAPTSAKPSNQREMTAPSGNRNTTGHMVGSIQAPTTERVLAKKQATSPVGVHYSNGHTVDRTGTIPYHIIPYHVHCLSNALR